MKHAFGEYERIARSTLGFSSLWLGEDHLLYIRGRGFILPFTEEYRRFRYQDVESLALARSSGVWLGAFGYLVSLLIFGGIGFALLSNRPPGDTRLLLIALAIPIPLSGLFLFLLIRHCRRGAYGTLELTTALKRERLRGVSRLREGKQVLSRLGDRIQAAQSDLAEAIPEPES